MSGSDTAGPMSGTDIAGVRFDQVAVATGVTLNVAVAGDAGAPPIILLHGFPESHRTWRHQIPVLARDHFVIAPDQRGFAASSKPGKIDDYATSRLVADLIALADHFDAPTFTLVGHDWGGAVAWGAALLHPARVGRLVIVNAPHPLVFQRSLFDNPAQRAASQYIRAFRNPQFEQHVAGIGIEGFFDTSFAPYIDPTRLGDERQVYLDQWSQPGTLAAMLNWYRASSMIVPAPGETPDRLAFLDLPFPPVTMPVLIIWGTGDKALLPAQLDGLDALVPDLTVRTVDAGHFVPWERPDAMTQALCDWLPA